MVQVYRILKWLAVSILITIGLYGWMVIFASNGKRSDKVAQLVNDSSVLQVDAIESRERLPEKILKAFRFAYDNYVDSFDWILKCDDDTYVIMENLKLLLSKLNPGDPTYLGFRMKVIVPNGYMSGGAGYLISSSGLKTVVKVGFQTGKCGEPIGDEDVKMGQCFRASGVRIIDSWDKLGLETFHPEPLEKYLHPPFPIWLENYAWKKPTFGPGCCSRHTISFHHVRPSDMLVYEQLLYKTDVG